MPYYFRSEANGSLSSQQWDSPPNASGWVEFADTDTTAQSANAALNEYTLVNGVLTHSNPVSDATKLATAQSARIAYLQQQRDKAVASSFTSAADGTSHTYSSNQSAQDIMHQLATAMSIGAAKWPQSWEDTSYNVVSLSQTQFTQLVNDFYSWKDAQWSHYQTLLQQVQQATTVNAVNAVTW